ncbi:MAG: ammonium transporter [Myxococcota bacterium]
MHVGLRKRFTANRLLALPILLLTSLPGLAMAEDVVDSGDTAWMLTSSALVLLMTVPGLALFYGGLVRVKNILSVLMQCMMAAGMVGLLWVIAGYSLAFGEGNAFFGNLSMLMLNGITPDSVEGTIPTYVWVSFQGMFAIITPALMLGAFAERIRFSAYLAFVAIWLFLVYVPMAHMVWGGGWIGAQLGALDFAGGLVVHMTSGFSALIACLVIGPRVGFRKEPMQPNSLPFTMIGASLLWFGWFGFNAGSALAADGVAGLAFLTTMTATAAAVFSWAIIEWMHRGKPTQLGSATAAVAGLVAITPACAFVGPGGSIFVGLGAAVFCYFFVTIVKNRMGYDDSLDVFGVHGIGGAWGALATALFIAPWALQEGVSQGEQFVKQLVSVGFTAVYACVITFVILLVLKAIMGDLRVSEDEEHEGLDLTQHTETAYGPPS